MTGDKITYGESIECPGRWRRMDYETTVQDGETEQSAGNRAQLFVQNFLSQNNPHLYQEQPDYVSDTNVGNILQESEPQSNTPKKLSQKELITQEINNAKTIKYLQEWKLLSDKYPDLKQIFEEKLNELTK